MSGELAKAVCTVMAAVRYVPETGKNTFHGYAYASDEDLLTVLQPAMAAAGLAMIPTHVDARTVEHAQDRKGKAQYRTDLIVTYALLHSSGESATIQAPGCGIDGEDKGVYKAMTGALKYALRHTFLVPTGQDAERDHREPEKESKAKPEPKKATNPDPKGSAAAPGSAAYDRALHSVCDELVELGWHRETIQADLRDFAAWLGTGDPWKVSAERLANIPGWVAANQAFEVRWEGWWATVDELLEKHSLTRAELAAWCVSIQRPEPHTMNEDARGKLLAYLMNADGMQRLVQHATQARGRAA